MFHPDLFSAAADHTSKERLRDAEQLRAVRAARAEQRAEQRAARKEERRRRREKDADGDPRAFFDRAA